MVHNEIDQLTCGRIRSCKMSHFESRHCQCPWLISILKAYFSIVIFDARSEGLRTGLMKIHVFCNFLPTCTASYPIIFEFLSYLISSFHVFLLILTGRFSIIFFHQFFMGTSFLFHPEKKARPTVFFSAPHYVMSHRLYNKSLSFQ